MSDSTNTPPDNIIPFARQDMPSKPSIPDKQSAPDKQSIPHKPSIVQELDLRPMTSEEDRALVGALMEMDMLDDEDESIVVANDRDTRH